MDKKAPINNTSNADLSESKDDKKEAWEPPTLTELDVASGTRITLSNVGDDGVIFS